MKSRLGQVGLKGMKDRETPVTINECRKITLFILNITFMGSISIFCNCPSNHLFVERKKYLVKNTPILVQLSCWSLPSSCQYYFFVFALRNRCLNSFSVLIVRTRCQHSLFVLVLSTRFLLRKQRLGHIVPNRPVWLYQ